MKTPATRFLLTWWVFGLLIGHSFPAAVSLADSVADRQTVIVVVGAAGEEEFGRRFAVWADRWAESARQAEATLVRIGQDTESESSDRQVLETTLVREATASSDTLWLVLLGHGTFDGKAAKFNLRGPDVSATELAGWLKPVTRPLVVINCSSSSSPFLTALSGKNRVIVTATKSGHERNFARFGEFLAASIVDPTADLDKDGQTSLLEAYLLASDLVTRFYEDQSRLATEHSLLDDNGDGMGTPADWYRGTRAVKTAKDGAAPDGIRANQISLLRSEQEKMLTPELRQRRDELELRLALHRLTKAKSDEAVYLQRLEVILRQLAELYEGSSSTPSAIAP